MITAEEIRNRIQQKAAEDAEFRSRLLSEPKAAIGQEFGVKVGESFDIEVHEESPSTAHLVLPMSDRLDVSELMAAGGEGDHDPDDGYD